MSAFDMTSRCRRELVSHPGISTFKRTHVRARTLAHIARKYGDYVALVRIYGIVRLRATRRRYSAVANWLDYTSATTYVSDDS